MDTGDSNPSPYTCAATSPTLALVFFKNHSVFSNTLSWPGIIHSKAHRIRSASWPAGRSTCTESLSLTLRTMWCIYIYMQCQHSYSQMGDGDRQTNQKAHGPPSLEVAAQGKQRSWINKETPNSWKLPFDFHMCTHTHSQNTEAEAKQATHKF